MKRKIKNVALIFLMCVSLAVPVITYSIAAEPLLSVTDEDVVTNTENNNSIANLENVEGSSIAVKRLIEESDNNTENEKEDIDENEETQNEESQEENKDLEENEEPEQPEELEVTTPAAAPKMFAAARGLSAGERLAAMISTDDIASGTSNDIAWVINKDGKLTVEGTGDWNDYYAPWHSSADEIISAEISLSGLHNATYMFDACSSLKSVNFDNFDTSTVTSMEGMFSYCTQLPSLDLSGFNTQNVTSMGGMFSGCENLKSVNLRSFNTPSLTNMYCMFSGCTSLESVDLSNFNASNVTEADSLFSNCESLTSVNLSGFNPSRSTRLNSMFYNCQNLETIDLSSFNTSEATDIGWMFAECKKLKNLDISNFNTEKVTNMNSFVRNCTSLTSLSMPFNTGNVTDMSSMFEGCSSLNYLDLSSFDTSKVTTMWKMFDGCSNLDTVNVSSFDTYSVTTMAYLFNGCSNLSTLDLSSFNYSSIERNNYKDGTSFILDGCSNIRDLKLCGFDNLKAGSTLFKDCNNLQKLDLSNAKIKKYTYSTDCPLYFSIPSSVEYLDLSYIDISDWTMPSFENAFANDDNLVSVDLTGIDTSHVTSMENMFKDCSSLESIINLDGLDTSNVTNMAYMFSGCSSLSSIDTSEFNTQNVTTMAGMFADCEGITELNLSNFNTANTENMSYMFSGCEALEQVTVSSFDARKVKDCTGMFKDCKSLSEIDLSNFSFNMIDGIAESDLSDDMVDAQFPQYVYPMFDGCDSLEVIHAPTNLYGSVPLPCTFYKVNTDPITSIFGQYIEVTKLPKGLTESIILAKDTNYFKNGATSSDIAHGQSNDVSWAINKYGKLTVMGSGDWERGTYQAPWLEYKESIKTVTVSLTGTTNMSNMFNGCSMLKEADLKNMSLSALTSSDNMFSGCTLLGTICTPTTIPAGKTILLSKKFKNILTGSIYTSLSSDNQNMTLTAYSESGGGSLESLMPASCQIDVPFSGNTLKIDWGTNLFKDGAYSYKKALAIAGLVLSAASEDSESQCKNILEKLGFKTVVSNSMYDQPFNFNLPACSFGSQEVSINGEKKLLVCAVIRGTQPVLGDIFTDLGAQVNGFVLSGENTSTFLREYIEAITPHYSVDASNPDNVMLYVTGHSLGGATAGRLAQEMSEYSGYDTFVYTYASPNYAVDSGSQLKNNVFNIINTNDYVPTIPLGYGRTGREQQFCACAKKAYLPVFKKLTGQDHLPYFWTKYNPATGILDAAFSTFGVSNHDVRTYMTYLLYDQNNTDPTSRIICGAFRCPVDIDIYDDNDNLIGRIRNNVIDTSVSSDLLELYVYNDEKFFTYYGTGSLVFKIYATDSGTLTYDATTVDISDSDVLENSKTFSNVVLEDGKEFYSVIEFTEPVTDTNLFVINPNTNEAIMSIAEDGTETPTPAAAWGDIIPEDRPAMSDDIPAGLWAAGINSNGYLYTGLAIKPNIRVYNGTKLLREKVDYTVTYARNVNAYALSEEDEGFSYAKAPAVTVTGKGNFTGKIVKTFVINPIDIEDAGSEFSAPDILLKYNKSVQKGTTKVTCLKNGQPYTMRSGSDFTYVYPGTNKKDTATYDSNAFKEPGTYAIDIVGKGNFTGKVRFNETITKNNLMSKLSYTIGNTEYVKDGAPFMPSKLIVKNGTKQLSGMRVDSVGEANAFVEKQNKDEVEKKADYVYYITGNDKVGTAYVTFTGIREKGYEGTFIKTYSITGIAMNRVTIANLKSSYTYTGNEINPFGGYTEKNADKPVTLKYGKDELADDDYELSTEGSTTEIGTVKVTITGKNRFTGSVVKTYSITGTALSQVSITLPDGTKYPYTGDAVTPDVKVYSSKLKRDLIKDTEYTVTYGNNINAGTKAEVKITGIGGYTGTVKKSFTITAKSFNNAAPSITLNNGNPVYYMKNGAKPPVTVKLGGTELSEGTDYKLSYSNNKSVRGKNEKNPPTVTVTGTGNYSGAVKAYFGIEKTTFESAGVASGTTATAADIIAQDKKTGLCKPTITLKDSAGTKLAFNTDYIIEKYEYAYDIEGTWQEKNGKVTDYIPHTFKMGDTVDNAKDVIPPGAGIYAVIRGRGTYSSRDEDIIKIPFYYVAGNIAGATVKIPSQVYTGKPVTLSEEDITVTMKGVSGTLKLGKDFEIVPDSYVNNTNKGTAKVTIRGKYDYNPEGGRGFFGGEKTVTFTITAWSMNYLIKYDPNTISADGAELKSKVTGTMKDSSLATGTKLAANAYKCSGYEFAGWNTDKSGTGKSYKNTETFRLKSFTQLLFGRTETLYAQWKPVNKK